MQRRRPGDRPERRPGRAQHLRLRRPRPGHQPHRRARHGHAAGDTYLLAQQVNAWTEGVTATGRYPWQLDVWASFSGRGDVRRTVSGTADVVSQKNSPFGAGWSLAGLDQFVVSGGVLDVHGSGGYHAFGGTATPGATYTYTSPANDYGTLTRNADSTFVYKAVDRIKYNFDSNGRETSIVDPHGLTRTFSYDGSSGRVLTIADPDGSTATFTYNGANLLTQIQAPNGTATLAYNGSELTTFTNADLAVRTFAYGSGSASYDRLSADNLNPLAATFSYDTAQTLLHADPGRLTASYHFNPAATRGLQTSPAVNALAAPTLHQAVSTDPNGSAATYTLDDLGRAQELDTADGATQTWARNAAGQVTSYVDGDTHTTSYGYDTHGNATTVTYADGTAETYQYGTSFPVPTQFKDRNNNLTTSTYDSTTGDLLTVTDALGGVTTFTYSQSGGVSNGLVQTIADPDGHVTSYGYDTGRHRTTEIDAYGTPLAVTHTLGYDTAGNRTSRTDAPNAPTSYGFDALRRPTSQAQSGLDTESYSYNAAGLVTDQSDAHGVRSTFAYDGRGLVTSRTDAPGTALAATTQYVYDPAGHLTGTFDPDNHSTFYTVDALGRRLTVRDALGNVATTAYDQAGNVTGTRDRDNNLTTYGVDAVNRRTSVTDAAGQTTRTYYDGNGAVTGTSDGDGHLTAYLFDAVGRLTVTTDGAGGVTTTLYDQAGNVTGVQDANRNLTQYVLDALGRATVTIDALSGRTTAALDAVGNKTAVLDASNRQTQFLVDADGRTTVTIDPAGNRDTVTYDGASNVTADTNPNGFATGATFDALNRRVNVTDRAGATTTTLYDLASNVTGVIDARGGLTQYLLDADARVTGTIDPLGKRTTTAYDNASNVTAVWDANGHATQYRFDAAGRASVTLDAFNQRTTLFDNAGNATAVTDGDNHTTVSSYDGDNRQVSVTDALGHTRATYYDKAGHVTGTTDGLHLTQYLIDALGRVSATIDGASATTTALFDAAGNVTGVLDARNHLTQYLRDGDARATVTIDPLNNRTTTSYDKAGQVTGVLDGNNHLTQYSYDGDGRQTAVTDALSHTRARAYDLAGNVTQVTDGNGHTTQTVFDADGRATVTIDGLGNRTTTLFDAAGNATSVTDAKNNVTTFAYDADNRKTSQTDALGHAATFAYDAAGLLTGTTDRLGRQRIFAYDAANRLTTETWYASGGGSPLATLLYGYDAAGNQTSASNAVGGYAMTYDGDNRVTAVSEPFGVRLTFSYDAVGNRTLVTDSFGGTTTSVYDADNNLTSRQFSTTASGLHALREDLTYDGANQVSTATRYADVGGTTTVGSTTYTYDAANRLTGLQHFDGTHASLANYTYSYDAGDRVTGESLNGTVTATYTYDNADEVTATGTKTYSYDATGNRTLTGYTTTAGNQLSSDGTWNYSYDAEGNETKKVNIATGLAWTYGYDNLNHMTYAKQWSADPGSGGTLQKEADYSYDVYGNLAEQDVYLPGPSTTTVARFVYDGWKTHLNAQGRAASFVGMENWDVWADLDGSNVLKVEYLRGDVVDQVFARSQADGTVGWLLTDRQGSVRQVTDGSGALNDTIAYDVYGNIVSESAPTWGGLYKWTGRLVDVASGLQYNRARWYDPTTGRWTSQDPLGFAAGDSNLYRYVANRPTLATDPTGLQTRARPYFQWSSVDVERWAGTFLEGEQAKNLALAATLPGPSMGLGGLMSSSIATLGANAYSVAVTKGDATLSSGLLQPLLKYWYTTLAGQVGILRPVAINSSPTLDLIRQLATGQNPNADAAWSGFLVEQFAKSYDLPGPLWGQLKGNLAQLSNKRFAVREGATQAALAILAGLSTVQQRGAGRQIQKYMKDMEDMKMKLDLETERRISQILQKGTPPPFGTVKEMSIFTNAFADMDVRQGYLTWVLTQFSVDRSRAILEPLRSLNFDDPGFLNTLKHLDSSLKNQTSG